MGRGVFLTVLLFSMTAHAQAPTSAVRSALAQIGPDISRCATAHPVPGTERTRRMRVRVWLYPNASWTMDVPELADQNAPNHAVLSACIRQVVAVRVTPVLRPFSGSTRIKVERAYTIRAPGPPPSSAQLGAFVARRRTQLVACVPGNGARGGQPAELIVRARLEMDGRLSVVGVGAPEGAPFDVVSLCVQAELAGQRHDPVTAPATFETALRFRYLQPAPI
jgi:hypothetical protein